MSDIIKRNTELTLVPDNVFTTKIKKEEEKTDLPEENLSLSFYPNPVTDKLTINIWLNEENEVRIRVFNILGTQLKEYIVVMDEGLNKINCIDFSNFSVGTILFFNGNQRRFWSYKIDKKIKI
ncbi:MAG: T9SS type A sorting domain-containing protein [Saprospiraceae bacterium]